MSMPRIVYIGARPTHPTHRAWFSSVEVTTIEPLVKGFKYSFMLNVLLSPFRRSLRNVDAVLAIEPKYLLLPMIIGKRTPKLIGLAVTSAVLYSDMWRIADAVIANSNLVKRILIKKGVEKGKIVTIYPFSTLENMTTTLREKERYAVYLVNDPARVLKGYQILLKILDRMPELIVYRLGRRRVPRKHTRIKDVGFLNLPEFKEVVSKAMVCLHPAIFDTFGVAPLDSLYLGTLPIVSRGAGVAKLLPKELVARDIDEFVDKIEMVYSLSRDEYQELLRRAISMVAKKTSRELSIRKFKETIMKILDSQNVYLQ